MHFTHTTVNHSENFVDPVTGIDTQTIESHWNILKRRNKRQCGTHRHLVESYMCEFLWRLRFNRQSLFDRILLDIQFINKTHF